MPSQAERQNDLEAAHERCIKNRDEILASDSCGCFYCLAVFGPCEIQSWVTEKDGERTALCPKCRVDSVIGSKSGFPIEREFLKRMQRHWF